MLFRSYSLLYPLSLMKRVIMSKPTLRICVTTSRHFRQSTEPMDCTNRYILALDHSFQWEKNRPWQAEVLRCVVIVSNCQGKFSQTRHTPWRTAVYCVTDMNMPSAYVAILWSEHAVDRLATEHHILDWVA